MPQRKTPPKFNYRHPLFFRGFFSGGLVTASVIIYADIIKRWYGQRHKDADNLAVESGETQGLEDVRILERGRQILKYGQPDIGSQVRYYGNHVLAYDQQKKTPVWVAEHLSADTLKGSANRKQAKFQSDPGIADMFSAQNADYWKSGWSRGHMAPAGDNKNSQTAMNDSFYLSNVVPQNYENNAGFWNRLEIYCRELASKYSSVYILSGPLTMPEVTEDGKKFVKYDLIGANRVAVPTHLFKVIIVENKKSKPIALGAFIVPNHPIGYKHELSEYQVPLSDLEQISGIKLTPDLDPTSVANLCTLDGCKLMDRNTFELYFLGRRLESANTIQRLTTVWSELKTKNLIPDAFLIDLYARKTIELENKNEQSNDS